MAAVRHGPTDAEFIYAVYKLLFKIGMSSPAGNILIIKNKDTWKRLRLKFGQVKRRGGPTITATTVETSATSPENSVQLSSRTVASDSAGLPSKKRFEFDDSDTLRLP